MKISKIDLNVKNISFYVIGVLIIGFGINLMLLSKLGAGAWDTPTANGQTFFNLVVGWEWVTLGMLSALVNSIILVMIIAYRKDFKYFIILLPIFIMGSVIDMWHFLLFQDAEVTSMIIQVLFYTIGGLLLPFGLALVVKSTFPAFVFEEWTFMLQEITKLSFQTVRVMIEMLGVLFGTIFALVTYFSVTDPTITMFGQVGVGTLILAVTIGPLVQFFMKALGVQKHDKEN